MDSAKRSSLAYRTGRITKAVNLSFRNIDSDSVYRFYVGSLGRNTAIPSVSDADLLLALINRQGRRSVPADHRTPAMQQVAD